MTHLGEATDDDLGNRRDWKAGDVGPISMPDGIHSTMQIPVGRFLVAGFSPCGRQRVGQKGVRKVLSTMNKLYAHRHQHYN